jgi:monoamine oxidase
MRASEVDVAVVGAGAAGVGAALAALAAGRSVAVLEARGRPGGRAWTSSLAGLPVDLGCEWLHEAERNPWVEEAGRLGFALDRREPEWGGRFGAHQLAPEERGEMRGAFDRFWAAVGEAADAGPDRTVAEVLPRDEARWRPAFDAVTSYISGAGIDEMSAADAGRYGGEGSNWRPVRGYGALVAARAAGLPVSYATPVSAIDLTGPRAALDTARGRLEAEAVILTASVGVLKAERIRIRPSLPPEIASALDGLAMGHVAKLFLTVRGRPWAPGPDAIVQGSFERARTGSYMLNPLGRPLVEAYFGGALAAELERAGPRAAAAFAADELAALFGEGVRARLGREGTAASAWAGDAWAMGAYSYARPGGADGRGRLSRPVLGRLFLAGEACSRDAYGTAHAAYRSGAEAARAACGATPEGG